MKKALALISAIALVATAAYADTPAPKATFTLSGTGTIKAADGINTAEAGTDGKSVSSLTPNALNVSSFVSTSTAAFDWTNFNVATEAKYDAFNTDKAAYSYLKSTAAIKNLYGFKVSYVFVLDNQKTGTSEVTNPATNGGGNIVSDTDEIVVEYDHLKTDGYKFWAEYTPSSIFDNLNIVTTGKGIQNVFSGFKEIGYEASSDEFGGKFVVQTPASNSTATKATVDVAQFELKKLFGIWSLSVNSGDAMKLRGGNLGSKVAISREAWEASDGVLDVNGDEARSYYLGYFRTGGTTTSGYTLYQNSKDYTDDVTNELQGNGRVNLFSTITPAKNLEIKVAAVGYDGKTASKITWRDYLKGRTDIAKIDDGTGKIDNLAFQVAYTVDGVGNIAFGAIPRFDYNTTSSGPYVTAPSSFSKTSTSAQQFKGTSFWLDANLSKLLGDKGGLYAYFDGSQIVYANAYQFGQDLAAASSTSQVTLKTSSALEFYLGAEAFYKVSDKIRVDAAAQFSGLAGYNYAAAVANKSWSDTMKPSSTTTYYSTSYTEGNYYADWLNQNPVVVSASVQYVLNPTVTPYIKDTYRSVYGNLAAISATSGMMGLKGYYDRNDIEIGAILTASKKSTLTVLTNLYQYPGVPDADKLYLATTTTSDAKTAAKNTYAKNVAAKCNPFLLSLKYTIKF